MPTIRIDEEAYDIVDRISRASNLKQVEVVSEMVRTARKYNEKWRKLDKKMKMLGEDENNDS